ncbi:hypothetical protein MMC14_010431 [Varicellaria rhodocarpa]|nr:hypothetical protein [Varicellaria rhodocarpa]
MKSQAPRPPACPPVPFQYDPLPSPNCIRLLEVKKEETTLNLDLEATKSTDRPVFNGHPLISCSLRIVNLDEKPSYDTLSYTWGDPLVDDSSLSPHNTFKHVCGVDSHSDSFQHNTDNHSSHHEHDEASFTLSETDTLSATGYSFYQTWPVCCNGKPLNIGQNLYEALRELKRSNVLEERDKVYNKTALIWAGEHGRFDIIESLLARGADVGSQDCFGETAMDYASENGHLEAVKALARAGSDIEILDKSRRTPLDCARERNYTNVVKFLETLRQNNANANARHLRSKTLFQPLVWIDAICIDQANTVERTAQVKIMWNIYRSAKRVIIWLGKECEGSESVGTLLSQLASISNKTISKIPPNTLSDVEFFAKIGIPDYSMERWECLLRFLRRAWFRRT